MLIESFRLCLALGHYEKRIPIAGMAARHSMITGNAFGRAGVGQKVLRASSKQVDQSNLLFGVAGAIEFRGAVPAPLGMYVTRGRKTTHSARQRGAKYIICRPPTSREPSYRPQTLFAVGASLVARPAVALRRVGV